MGLRVAKLRDDDSIEAYTRRFSELVGVSLPVEYVRRGSVYGCFDDSGQLVGGYTLMTVPPYRGVVFLPDAVRNNHWLFQSVTQNNMVEINGVYLEPRVRLSAREWYGFWWRLFGTLRGTGRRYVLIWWNDLNAHLHRLYGRLKIEHVYKGPSAPNGNESSHPLISVAWTTPARLYYSIFASVAAHLPKRAKRKTRKLWKLWKKLTAAA